MSRILVDTSIWINFFRGDSVADPLADLIEQNQIVINDLILAELLPPIYHKKESKLAELLLVVERIELAIDWPRLIHIQSANLAAGQNHIGIPDLIVALNALSGDLVLFENDKHFLSLGERFGLRLFRHQR